MNLVTQRHSALATHSLLLLLLLLHNLLFPFCAYRSHPWFPDAHAMVCVMSEDAAAAAAGSSNAAAAAATAANGPSSSSCSGGALRPLVFTHKLQHCGVTALTLALAGTGCRVSGHAE
jgi:hypothetical protein